MRCGLLTVVVYIGVRHHVHSVVLFWVQKTPWPIKIMYLDWTCSCNLNFHSCHLRVEIYVEQRDIFIVKIPQLNYTYYLCSTTSCASILRSLPPHQSFSNITKPSTYLKPCSPSHPTPPHPKTVFFSICDEDPRSCCDHYWTFDQGIASFPCMEVR